MLAYVEHLCFFIFENENVSVKNIKLSLEISIIIFYIFICSIYTTITCIYLGPGKVPAPRKKHSGKNKIPTYFKSTPSYSTSIFIIEYKISNQSDKK